MMDALKLRSVLISVLTVLTGTCPCARADIVFDTNGHHDITVPLVSTDDVNITTNDVVKIWQGGSLTAADLFDVRGRLELRHATAAVDGGGSFKEFPGGGSGSNTAR